MAHQRDRRNRSQATREQTIGPFYPWAWLDDARADLTFRHPALVFRAQGQPIILRGRCFENTGLRATLMILEFWQPNANGIYRTPESQGDARLDPHFDGYTRIVAPDGEFALKTIMPGAQQSANGVRAPNITLTIFCDGVDRLVTQIFFDDQPENERDLLLASLPGDLRPRLIAQRQRRAANDIPVYDIDIRLSGDGETPFFDDLQGEASDD